MSLTSENEINTTTPIDVMIIEDNAEYRSAVALALQHEPNISLDLQFQTAEIAIRSLKKSERVPEVILLDIRLPGISGIEAIPRLLELAPDSKIVVLTQSEQETDVVKAISLGAFGYLLKSASVTDIVGAIRSAANGDATIDSRIAKYLLSSVRSKTTPSKDKWVLSNREMEVLTLLAEGLVKKEIAKQLEISYTTVDTHVSRIYGKLKVNNAPAAVNRAHRMNLLPPNDE